ncbi:MAG TPA: M48 family metallopeptidase, partial [Candidatus Pacearchaeota archaeon]|nr:M48 family metallopeptidase [Candidatus Pacearchaeota archaeon]
MATIYTHADENIKKTWLLLTFFFVFLVGLGWLLSQALGDSSFLYIAVAIAVFQSFFSYWFSDKIVLSMAGARPIEKRDNPELYRLVENLAIAAGLPLPKIYIINEAQPNAFATGRDKDHAVVAVTRGLLDRLDKTELEGVIAHELSHIGNKDMLLQTIVVILVGVIAIISDLFLRLSFWGGGRRDDRGNAGLLMLAFGVAAAILAPLAATMIQLAISRKREFLADASAALLTRYPEGLAGALQKIASDPNPMRGAKDSTAHLYIASPFRGKQKNWFSKL